MTENELATIAVDICYKIHTTLGPGLPESIYETAFAYELDKRSILYTRQQGVVANYKDIVLDAGFRADIIMENKLIVEIKSMEHLEKVHHKAVLTYLKLTGVKLAILFNFNVNFIKDGLHRNFMANYYKTIPPIYKKYAVIFPGALSAFVGYFILRKQRNFSWRP